MQFLPSKSKTAMPWGYFDASLNDITIHVPMSFAGAVMNPSRGAIANQYPSFNLLVAMFSHSLCKKR